MSGGGEGDDYLLRVCSTKYPGDSRSWTTIIPRAHNIQPGGFQGKAFNFSRRPEHRQGFAPSSALPETRSNGALNVCTPSTIVYKNEASSKAV